MNEREKMQSQYFEKFQAVQNGTISAQEWQDFCFQLLSLIMEDEKEIFVRLKNRG